MIPSPYKKIGNYGQFLLEIVKHPETIDIMPASHIFLGQFLVTCNFFLLFALSSQIFRLVFVGRIQVILAKYKTP
jgi:hypothetical protein